VDQSHGRLHTVTLSIILQADCAAKLIM
jgi:hypothetical protein